MVERSSWEWPRHWQRVIARISKEFRVESHKHVFVVHVYNPEYLTFISNNGIEAGLSNAPARTAGTIEFDTPEALDEWARVADRLTSA